MPFLLTLLIFALHKPSVLIAGLDLPAKVIKEGALEEVDLTLLSVDEEKLPISLRTRHMRLCEMPPEIDERCRRCGSGRHGAVAHNVARIAPTKPARTI